MDNSFNSKALFAFLGGLAAGAAVGILLAPEKGSETRRKLTDSAKKLGDTVRQKAEESMQYLADSRDQLRDKAQQAGDKAQQFAGNMGDQARDKAKEQMR